MSKLSGHGDRNKRKKESAINYIKIFQNAHTLSVSVGDSYSEDQMMHKFLDNLHQVFKIFCSNSQPPGRVKEKNVFTDQKYLSISSLQTNYLNLGSSPGFGKIVKEKTLFRKSAPFVEVLITLRKILSKRSDRKKENFRAAGHSDNRQTERPPPKCFICGYEDHLIAKCPNPPKDNQKRLNQVRYNGKGNCTHDKGKNNSDQKIYTSKAHMSGNGKFPCGNFSDSSQLTSWFLNYGETCHMTPEVSYFN